MALTLTALSHTNLGEPFLDGLDWAELMDTTPDIASPVCASSTVGTVGTGGDAGPACLPLEGVEAFLSDEITLDSALDDELADFDLTDFLGASPVLPLPPLQIPAGKQEQHRQQLYALRRASIASSSSSDSGMDADTDSGSESSSPSSSSPSSPPDGLDGWIAALPAGAGQTKSYTVASAKNSIPSAGKTSKGLRRPASAAAAAAAAAATAEDHLATKHRTSESLVASITPRERALLEGKAVTVPTVKDLPLTKAEESRLRASLRKIRNKDSAIRSRKKKEVYVAGLEVRVEECTRVNVALSSKVTSLEQTNRSLLEQLNDLRRQVSLMPNAGGTVMMMVIVCCGLQLGPSGALSSLPSAGSGSFSAPAPVPGFRSRTLKSVHDLDTAESWAGAEDGFVAVAIARWAVAFAAVAAVWFLTRRDGRKLLKSN